MVKVFYGVEFSLLLSSNVLYNIWRFTLSKNIVPEIPSLGRIERTSVNSSFQLINTQTEKVVVFAEMIVF